jgi:hypothetical protein
MAGRKTRPSKFDAENVVQKLGSPGLDAARRLSAEGEPFKISLKLPFTAYEALKLPYARPTEYGLGKAGWVTLTPNGAPFRRSNNCSPGSTKATAPRRRRS